MFLIPAVTMRSLAGERTEGTLDLLLTKPVSRIGVLSGKYLGSLTIVVLALVPTGVYYYAVYQLGSPAGNIDTGAVIGSYIGLFLLGSAFTAIGTLTSAISRTPIVAFLLAVLCCFFCFYAFDALRGIPALSGWENIIGSLGIQAHYAALSRGVLDSRDLVYFCSFIIILLFSALLVLTDRGGLRTKRLTYSLIMCGGLIALNLLTAQFFGRIDFTEDKRFTLSPLSRKTAGNLTGDIHITVLLDGTLPSGFERLKQATADLLADLKAYSHGKLTYTFVDPLTNDQTRQQEQIAALSALGISPTNLTVRTDEGLTQKLIFPGALVSCGDEQLAVNLLQSRSGTSHEEVLNNSVQNLEYAFVSALRKITSGGKPLIGFTEGHGEPDELQLQDAIHSLSDGFQVGFVNLQQIEPEGLRQLKVLIVAQPRQPFTEAEKYKINDFVMNGGRILWAIDQVTASLDSLRATGEQLAVARQLNLDDLLFTYGVRLNYNLIADINSAQIPLTVGNIGGQAQVELAPWLFFPVFVPLTNHPVLKNLDGIRCEFAGTLDTVSAPGVRKEIILQSSPYSRLLDVPATISLQMAGETPDPATFKNRAFPVAATLEGTFPSVFLNRPVPEGITPVPQPAPKSKPAKMLVIADGDLLKSQLNPADGSAYPLGWDRYTKQQYGNRSFLLNAVDYLADDSGLIALRSKEVKLRLLNPVKLKQDAVYWKTLNTALPPLLLLLIGLIWQYRRKRRYS